LYSLTIREWVRTLAKECMNPTFGEPVRSGRIKPVHFPGLPVVASILPVWEAFG
jgi:hypothetical protein